MQQATVRKAVFPVAGLGTRFLPATKASPKEMLPVVDKPLIQYAVEEAYAAGIRHMIFVTGRSKRAIEDHFDTAYELESELEAKNKTALLAPFNLSPNGGADVFFVPSHADDILYGGLGNDFIHGGAGDDAISGTEALELYYTNPVNPGHVLGYDPNTTLFAAYNSNAPMARVFVDENGVNTTSGGVEFLLNFASGAGEWDGNDRIFGDLGNDWLVGGPGQDQLFGGMGDDLLNADDYHDPLTTNTEVDVPPADQPTNYYDDITFGGGGRDVLIASSIGDAMVDWVGEFNSYVVPTSKFGPGSIIRFSNDSIVQFLVDLALSSGLDKTAGRSVLVADPARYFEPYGELGIVLNGDPFSSDQNGAPRDPQPGNKGGVKK